MKKLQIHQALLTLAALLSISSTSAQRISEPDSIFYGAVFQRVAGRMFLMKSGELTWTFTTSGPGGREHRFTTKLESQDRYSYRLRIPHQLLAYDFTVASNAVALPSAGAPIERIAVSLNGQPLGITPLAMEAASFTPQRRAMTHRIDLEVAGEPVDSDGDGAPDWWEDANSLDKWDPTDAAGVLEPNPDTSPASTTQQARTFAEWRAALFPGDSRNLDLFGQDDADGDGIANLFEYAFDLDPLRAETEATLALPHMVNNAGNAVIQFRKRTLATDIQYRVDVSTNLVSWSDGAGDVNEARSGGEGHTVLSQKPGGGAYRFFRIRVVRDQIP